MALPQPQQWTVQEYLDHERADEARHELVAGQIYAMAGASERHNQIAAALHYLLYGQFLERPCQVFQSDMRVAAAENAFFYPDLVVVCGEARYMDAKRDTLLNPAVIIEILSPSTEDFDRGRKFKLYRGIPGLSDYLLVSQKQVLIEHYSRQPGNSWILHDFSQPTDQIALPSIDCTLLLSAVYQRVNFHDES
ncbi:MAG: Uma2 family endonuclease [Anaerolineaceae bacterium]|nr:Uma2 family endonuclease [Anaerolineaceae bacterium]